MTRKDRLCLQLLNFFAALLARLGFGGLAVLGNILGTLIWLAVPRRRRMATRNLADCLQLPEKSAALLARRSFCHSARSFAEILLTDQFGFDSPRLRIAQPELFQALLASPRPIVAISGHLGAWEFVPAVFGNLYPPPRPCMVVTRRYPNPAVQAFIVARREARGATMIGHRTVAVDVLRALRKNGIVGFLVDHHAVRNEALVCSFLGKKAFVNLGPALLAVRAEALIWPIFMLRENTGYVLEMGTPLDTLDLGGNREEKTQAVVRFYTRAVENMIFAYPEQWFWMHNRWKEMETADQP